MTVYWYKQCSICKQGMLEIRHDITHNCLYLECDECSWSWYDPKAFDDNKNGFIKLITEFDSEPADMDTINEYGWSQYVLGSYIKNDKGRWG